MKTFDGDFDKFLNKIKSGECFSLSRWGDGELMILEGKPIDLLCKGNGEFKYDPRVDKYVNVRNKLIESFTYKSHCYYIGIACPCCVGQVNYEYMKTKSTQDEEHLTWANIFVNANFKRTQNELIPELNNHKIYMVINKNSKVDNLPFKYEKIWYVGADAWKNNYSLVDEISRYISDNKIENSIFLFAAGPFANILTYELWRYASVNNTYIDIGSILDSYLQLKLTRGYHLGAPTLNKVCIW